MQFLPAIDIRGGQCVRLLQGDFAKETGYGDPLDQAASYVADGAPALHVVDLDAARGTTPDNSTVVAAILSSVGVPVEVSGGVRDERRAEELLGLGAARVVFGTLAVEEPDLVRALACAHPEAIAIGLDHRDGELALRGWEQGAGLELEAVLSWFEDVPLGAVIVTPIDRDGMLSGPDLGGYASLLQRSALPIVASGGVATVEDLAALRLLEVNGRRLAGVVVGKALLSGAMTVKEAVAACAP